MNSLDPNQNNSTNCTHHTHIPRIRPKKGSRSPRVYRRQQQGQMPMQPSPSPQPPDRASPRPSSMTSAGSVGVTPSMSPNSPPKQPIDVSIDDEESPLSEEELMRKVVNPLSTQSSNGESEVELLPPISDESQSVELRFRKLAPTAEVKVEKKTPAVLVQHLAKAELSAKASTPEQKLEPAGVEEFVPRRRTSMLTEEKEEGKLKPSAELGDEDEMEVVSKSSVLEREKMLKGLGIAGALLAVLGVGMATYWAFKGKK